MNTTTIPQPQPVSNVRVVPPTNTPVPTIAEDDFTVDDPEKDIMELDNSAATL